MFLQTLWHNFWNRVADLGGFVLDFIIHVGGFVLDILLTVGEILGDIGDGLG